MFDRNRTGVRALSALTLAAALQACGGSSSGPPTGLSYNGPEGALLLGYSIPHFVPQLASGQATSYAVTPGLPAGLAIDAATGVISGIPSATLTETTFTVTASNDKGDEALATVELEVDSDFDQPRFAYVSNYSDHTISMFVVDAETGQMKPNGYVGANQHPVGLTTTKSGHFVYSANSGAGDITTFRVLPDTGKLEFVGSTYSGPGVVEVVFSPDGRFAYAANSAGTSIAGIDPANAAGAFGSTVRSFRVEGDGRLTAIDSDTAGGPVALVMHPSGEFVYSANFRNNTVGVYSVDPVNGSLTEIASVPTGDSPAGIAIDPSGSFLYAANNVSADLSVFSIDPITGGLTSVQTMPAGFAPIDVVVDAAGDYVYMTNIEAKTVSWFAIHPTTGALTYIDEELAGPSPFFLEPAATGNHMYLTHLESNEITRFEIDGPSGFATGDLTALDRARARFSTADVAILHGPTPLTFEPQLGFVANSNFNDVSVMGIDAASGLLTDLGTPIATGTFPFSLAIDPDGNFLYSVNQDSGDITQFEVLGEEKDLVESGLPVFASLGIRSIAVDPSGTYAFAVGNDQLFSYLIDRASGVLTPIQSLATGADPVWVTVDPTGRFVYAVNQTSNDISTYVIHPLTGEITETAGSPYAGEPGAVPASMSFHPSGRFAYVANEVGDSVTAYRVSDLVGDLHLIETEGVGTAPRSLTVSPDGRYVLVGNADSNDVTLLSVDLALGGLTRHGEFAAGLEPSAVEVEASGRFAYVTARTADNVTTFEIDRDNDLLLAIDTLPLATGAAPTALITQSRLVEAVAAP